MVINKVIFNSNLTECEVLKKKIKGLYSSLIYRVYKDLRNTGSILRMPGSGRKEKIDDNKFELIKDMLKEDNTLTALAIKKKLSNKEVEIYTSKI